MKKTSVKRLISGALKAVTAAALALTIAASPALSVIDAAGIMAMGSYSNNVNNYMPVHVALVIDASGSIASPTESNPSDPDLISREAAKVVVNNITAKDNSIAIFEYSSGTRQKEPLTPITENNIKKLNDTLSGMTETRGATYMISAIEDARKYLDENHEEGVRDVIIVFTDGAENERINANSPDERIVSEVSKALGSSKPVVYCVGFDYLDDNGDHSLSGSDGKPGYGKKILDEFARQSGGTVFTVKDNINDLGEEFLNMISELNKVAIEPIKMDFDETSGTYTADIAIDESVVEANIRVTSDDKEAISAGKMLIQSPSGESVVLGTDSRDDVWYNKDKLAANIKLIMPEPGIWHLVVSDVITKDDININLLQNMNITSQTQFTLNGGSNTDVLNMGDTLGIDTKLLSDGEAATSPALYNDPDTSAKVFLCSDTMASVDPALSSWDEVGSFLRSRSNDQVIDLSSTGSSFHGDLTLQNEGTYLLDIWVESKRFCCVESYIITVGNDITRVGTPDEINIDDGETFVYSGIDAFSSSPAATAVVTGGDTGVAEASITGSDLTVTGKAPGSTDVIVTYTIGEKSVEVPFHVNVFNKPPVIEYKGVIKVRVEETRTLDDIAKATSDQEGDPLTYRILSNSDDTVADVSFSGSDLVVKGLKEGKADVEIEVSDGYSPVTRILRVEVRSKGLSLPVLGAIIAACAAALGALLYFLINSTRRVRHNWKNVRVGPNASQGSLMKLTDEFYMTQSMGKKKKVTVYDVIRWFSAQIDLDAQALLYLNGLLYTDAAHTVPNEEFKALLSKAVVTGGRKSKDPDELSAQDPMIQAAGYQPGDRFTYKITGDGAQGQVEITFTLDAETEKRFVLSFSYGDVPGTGSGYDTPYGDPYATGAGSGSGYPGYGSTDTGSGYPGYGSGSSDSSGYGGYGSSGTSGYGGYGSSDSSGYGGYGSGSSDGSDGSGSGDSFNDY